MKGSPAVTMETTHNFSERQGVQETQQLNESFIDGLLRLHEIGYEPMQMITDFALQKANRVDQE